MKKSKVLILTSRDVLDKTSWSGTDYMMYKALVDQGHEIILSGPIRKYRLLELAKKYINSVLFMVFKKKYNWSSSNLRGYIIGKKIKRNVEKKDYDVVFAPAASLEMNYFKTSKPIIYLSDSAASLLTSYYDQYKYFFEFSNKEFYSIEDNAIKVSSAIVYPSKWVYDFVKSNYKDVENKLRYVNLGANISIEPDRELINPKSRFEKKQLLFIGRDWERKGGDIVYKCFIGLIENGIDCELVVCGCTPPVSHPKMKVYPYLNKNNKKDFDLFQEILYQSALLFVPSKAECYGIVYCEAAAYGLPVISTNTGGIASIVVNKKTGILINEDADVSEYLKSVKQILLNEDIYVQFSKNSLFEYDIRLNWMCWGSEVSKIIEEVVEKKDKKIIDWNRERSDKYWVPSVRLLKSIRDYQKYDNSIIYILSKKIAVLRHRFWSVVTGADIPLNSLIGGGLMIPHPNGIVIHPEAKIGNNCIIFQQVTIGKGRGGVPTIGHNVSIGAGAKVLGKITIGDNVVIGANSVVTKSIPCNVIVKGIPAS